MWVVSPKPVVRQFYQSRQKTAIQHHVFGDRSPVFGPGLSIISHKKYNEAHFILRVARMNSVVLFGLREWPVYLDYVVTRARVPHLLLSNISQNAKFSGKVQELNEGHICPVICFISKTYHSISIKFPIARTY
jgi:hypothetical protein